jgi:hypothetical protein
MERPIQPDLSVLGRGKLVGLPVLYPPGNQATGAQDLGRLTNLMHLNVDTSSFIRYRSATNPDFGATFPQAINISDRTAIPRTNADFGDAVPSALVAEFNGDVVRNLSPLAARSVGVVSPMNTERGHALFPVL